MRVVTFPTDFYPERAAAEIAGALQRFLAGRRANLGLAGGSTPKPVYQALSREPLPWNEVDLWLSDERWVPLDHPESNGRMAADTLASKVDAAFHRPRFSKLLEAEDSAAHYEAELRRLFDDGRPDVLLLGMGGDGHTASLFPDTQALEAPPDRWYVANWVPKLETWRLTVTPALIRRARTVVVLVTGAAKAGLVAEVLERGETRYPIGVVREAEGEVMWVLDEAAARLLPR